MARNLIFYILLIVVLFAGFGNLFDAVPTRSLSYSEFLDKVEAREIKGVRISDRRINGDFRDNSGKFLTYAPADDEKLVDRLRTAGIEINVEPPSANWVSGLFLQWLLPLIIIVAFWMFLLNRADGNGSRAMSFARSRAKLFSEQKVKETFVDVAGCDEAKEELLEVVEFLREPKRFQRLGGKIPRGVLLVGPPGTGKTLLARAVAGEAKVPFFSISGSDFVEMFVGVGAARVRDLFQQGKKAAPCIIFIDELDAVGRQRGTGLGGGHDEREQTLNQLLVEMDGFEGTEGIILLSATNRPDVLDPALLRPGRFDREVTVDIPDLKGREEILRVHTGNVPMAADVDLSVLARGTAGLAGADLANLINEAALHAARVRHEEVSIDDVEYARDKVLMGTERKSRVISPEEKKVTAYHEAGHALVSRCLPETDPIHKVTIIPRGRALGVTHSLPEKDRYHYSKEYFLQRIIILLGGRAAEELAFNKSYTGAEHDMSVATNLAQNMVCAWGMSDLGPRSFGRREEHVFLGREIARTQDYSEETARRIDVEITRFVQSGYEKAREILTSRMETLHRIATALLERETITGEELDQIIGETA